MGQGCLLDATLYGGSVTVVFCTLLTNDGESEY